MIYWEQNAARRMKKGMLVIIALAITCGLAGCDGGYRPHVATCTTQALASQR